MQFAVPHATIGSIPSLDTRLRHTEQDVGSATRFIALALLLYLLAYFADRHTFHVQFDAIPFALSDYAFFLLGACGLLLCPPLPTERPFLRAFLLMELGYLLAMAMSPDPFSSVKRCVTFALWSMSTLGAARLLVDKTLVKMVHLWIAAVWLRWVLYVAWAYVRNPGGPPTSYFTTSRSRATYDHAEIAVYVCFAGVYMAYHLLSKPELKTQIAAAMVIVCTLATNMASFSRAGVVATAVGFGAVLVNFMRDRKRGLVVALGLSLLLATAGVSKLGALVDAAFQRVEFTDVSYHLETTGARRLVLRKALAAALTFPTFIVGVGHGNFRTWTAPSYSQHADFDETSSVHDILLHNTHLTVLLEGGLIAFFGWVLLLRILTKKPFSGPHSVDSKAALRGTALAYAMLTCVVMLTFIDYEGGFFWFLCALVLGKNNLVASVKVTP